MTLLGFMNLSGTTTFTGPSYYQDLITSTRVANIFYTNESVVLSLPEAITDQTYEVLDYYGDYVTTATTLSSQTLNLGTMDAGWYLLRIRTTGTPDAVFGDAAGWATFAVLTPNAEFPTAPADGYDGSPAQTGYNNKWYPWLRGVFGAGTARMVIVDAASPDESTDAIGGNVSQNKWLYDQFELWTPTDDARPNYYWTSFPNGAYNGDGTRVKASGAAEAATELYPYGIVGYEGPKNEPNITNASAALPFIAGMKQMYEEIKWAVPNAELMAPNPVRIQVEDEDVYDNPVPEMIKHWLENGGKPYTDKVSFHPYNSCYPGDFGMQRFDYGNLRRLLDQWGYTIEEDAFQTEQGWRWATYGVLDHRGAGTQAVNMSLLSEALGVPIHHSDYWYAKNHGFWDYPGFFAFRANEGYGMSPGLVMFRTFRAELLDKAFTKELISEWIEQQIMCVSLFTDVNNGAQCVAWAGAGVVDHSIRINLPNGSYTLVDAWGNESSVSVTLGYYEATLKELPQYLRVGAGVNVTCDSMVGRTVGTKESGAWSPTKTTDSFHPQNITTTLFPAAGQNMTARPASHGFRFPAGSTWPEPIEIRYPNERTFDQVVVIGTSTHLSHCKLTEFAIDVGDGVGGWTQVYTWASTRTESDEWHTFYNLNTRSYFDSFVEPRVNFVCDLGATQTTDRIRLRVISTAYGAWRSPTTEAEDPYINRDAFDTTTDTGTDTFDAVAHGLSDGNHVQLTANPGMPGGFSAATSYYVVNKTDDTFQLSATEGGSPIAPTTAVTVSVQQHYKAVGDQIRLRGVHICDTTANTEQFASVGLGTSQYIG